MAPTCSPNKTLTSISIDRLHQSALSPQFCRTRSPSGTSQGTKRGSDAIEETDNISPTGTPKAAKRNPSVALRKEDKVEADPGSALGQCRPRMRSSIACSRCRRSKVKCVNNGVGTTCRACETTGRDCTYPVPLAGLKSGIRGASSELLSREAANDQHESSRTARKPRPRKTPGVQEALTKMSVHAQIDALDASILTPQVWMELFEIWSLHYSTDLPFIHPPSFLQPVMQADRTFRTSAWPAASPVALLAFLALTSRFHAMLVAHHSPSSSIRSSDPLAASQFYASACRAKLAGNSGDALGVPSLDKIQALAMLALHDWGNCAGQKAWVGLGVAVRYAQILGLQYQQEISKDGRAGFTEPSFGAHFGLGSGSDSTQSPLDEEADRRLFWGLFILDRYLSSGKYRPQMLMAADIEIQLPSSERSFMFKESVRTYLLSDVAQGKSSRPTAHASEGESSSSQLQLDVDGRRWEVGTDEGVISRYIRAIELYGKIIHWSCSGGRRHDQTAPWDNNAAWFRMNAELDEMNQQLPQDLTPTTANLNAHIMSKSSTPFVMMHSVLLLGRMMLHREYLPFIPLRCSMPEGPLDPPLFDSKHNKVPLGFWEHSASELFRSARALVDLAGVCNEWKVLPQTPVMGFAVYIAAFTGVYAINFPWMDTNGYMCRKLALGTTNEDVSGPEASRSALSLIAHIKRRLRLADGWFKTINQVHRYYVRVKKHFRHNIQAFGARSGVSSHPSLREGGIGGGLEEFKMIEATLKEFGSLGNDDDREITDAHQPDPDGAGSATEGVNARIMTELMELQAKDSDDASRYDQWRAINARPRAGVEKPFSHQTVSVSQVPALSVQSQQHPPQSPTLAQDLQSAASAPNHGPRISSSISTLRTPEDIEEWLQSLNTAFTADDLGAFVEGMNWQLWSQHTSSMPQRGWFDTVWSDFSTN